MQVIDQTVRVFLRFLGGVEMMVLLVSHNKYVCILNFKIADKHSYHNFMLSLQETTQHVSYMYTKVKVLSM